MSDLFATNVQYHSWLGFCLIAEARDRWQGRAGERVFLKHADEDFHFKLYFIRPLPFEWQRIWDAIIWRSDNGDDEDSVIFGHDAVYIGT
jgi:hypothetical protein